jgi:hypothetical protein
MLDTCMELHGMTNDDWRIVDVALPPGRRSDALWAGGRGVGATSRRLRSTILKK